MAGQGDLTDVELLVLSSLRTSKDIGDLAKQTKLKPASLGKAIATLQLQGYIGDDGRLTEKGQKALEI